MPPGELRLAPTLLSGMTFRFYRYDLDEEEVNWFRGKTRRARAEMGNFLASLRDRALSGSANGDGGVEMTDIGDNLAIEAAYPERGDAVAVTENPMRAAESTTAAEAANAERQDRALAVASNKMMSAIMVVKILGWDALPGNR